jgi:Uma2 family endonuclease
MNAALAKPAGAWTYEDLLALPDDGKRYEIIEGELFEMPPPNWNHAVTIIALLELLLPLVAALRGEIATAPVGVFFPGADPVEPDIVVLLPESPASPARRGVEGAPDLVVEVLSPSNRTHDRLTKRALYAQAGVREYWLVDPERRSVEVLSLDRDALRVAQIAAGDETIVSPLLGGAAFPLAAIFARVRGFEAE